MRTAAKLALWLVALYLVANLVYAAKSLMGVNLSAGHKGSLFPLGDWLYRLFGHRGT